MTSHQVLKKPALVMGACLLVTSSSVFANTYVSFSAAWAKLDDSTNSGQLTQTFTTGTGNTLPATPLPAGTALGWETEFDNGTSFSLALGHRYDSGLGIEVEYSQQTNDVKNHRNVSAAGIPLDGEDVSVLITGATPTGSTVGQVVANGRGEIESRYLMLNAYYNFDLGGSLSPYLGVGIGAANIDVTFNPSGVPIINDDERKAAYQLMAGLSWQVMETVSLFTAYRYRATEDVSVNATLLPASLEVENKSHLIELGLRYHF